MKTSSLFIFHLLCCASLWLTACHTNGEEPARLETKEFASPSMPWRPIPLWFWNNTQVSGNTISQQLQQMIETDGYGGCAILPFGQNFRPSYLSSAYFTLYAKAVEKARALGAHMSIYDEYGFPSGSMGAINGSGVTTFKNNHPEHTVKRLDKSEYRVASGATIDRTLTPKGQLMALVARNVATKEVVSLEFTVRQTEDTKRINSTTHKLRFRGLVYNITGTLPDYKSLEYMKIIAETRKAGEQDDFY